MKNAFKFVVCLLTAVLFLGVFGMTAFAGKPTPKPTPIATPTPTPAPTLIQLQYTVPTEIKENQVYTIDISSTYTKDLKWTVSTTWGIVAIAPPATRAIDGNKTTLTIGPDAAGSGIIKVTATDSTNRKIKTTIEIKLTVMASELDPVYLALGDSIPYGYYYSSLLNYLAGGTDTNSYVEQFRDRRGILPGNYYDESVSGYNSIDVLNQLGNAGISQLISSADVITLCVGAKDIMDAAPRLLTGLDKYNIDWSVADQGRDAFEANWYRIIDGIEGLNPDVTLIVMTVYNPYRLTDAYYVQTDPYFSETTEGDLGLNYIIQNTETLYDSLLWDGFDYRVVDVYKAFNDSVNKDSLTGFYSSFCDPHPNQAGQNLIFTKHDSVYGQ